MSPFAGKRAYDKEMEEEANWLGPALLISDEAAMHIAAMGLTIAKASDMYGASEPLVQMRLERHRCLSTPCEPAALCLTAVG